MTLLQEVQKVKVPEPEAAPGGWNVGHLANLGVLLSCTGFSARFDLHNLNLLFDFVEDGEGGEIRDHRGRVIEVMVSEAGVALHVRDEEDFPAGILLDKDALKEMGIEEYEEEEPQEEFDDLDIDDTISRSDYDILDEGIKRAYRRVGQKIKTGYRVTSGFRKGRVVANAKNAFKPRVKSSTSMKLKIAARRKKIIRILKGKRTRRRASSKRLASLNKSRK